MGGREGHVDPLAFSNFYENEKCIEKENEAMLVCNCVFVKSDKISLRIRLAGLGSQIKELKIN